jgi:acyl-CoA synthetase (AMP-forming)/AMP-acid ligase II
VRNVPPNAPLLPPYRSIADVPYLQARERGPKVALVQGGTALRYDELDERCRRFAAWLRARGHAPGARVALLLPNVPEFAVAYFGAIAAGAVAVPINYRLAPAEVGYVVSDCAATVMVTTRAQVESLRALAEVRSVAAWRVVDDPPPGAVGFADALRPEPVAAPAAAGPDDVAVLLYTSGTTGFPKGAMLTHANTLFNARSCRVALGYRAEDVGLVTVPLFHVTGLNSQLVALLAAGATAVIQRQYDTREMLQLASTHRATALFLVPAIYKLITLRADLADHDLSAVRIAAYGGAPMDPETVRALGRILPGAALHNCYGLTESSSLATVLPAELALSRVESVGRAVPDTAAEVRGPDGVGRLPAGEPGELWLRGPNIVRGYWNAPERTREAIRDGWLRTGDLARMDGDGLVTILDRVKDMINRGGEKIFGLEVENVLYSFPGVAEAAVVGMPHPIFGEEPVAFVVGFPGVPLDPEAIRKYCGTRLADYKVPVAVHVLERLPRNPAGKVLKRDLKRASGANPEENKR